MSTSEPTTKSISQRVQALLDQLTATAKTAPTLVEAADCIARALPTKGRLGKPDDCPLANYLYRELDSGFEIYVDLAFPPKVDNPTAQADDPAFLASVNGFVDILWEGPVPPDDWEQFEVRVPLSPELVAFVLRFDLGKYPDLTIPVSVGKNR